MEQHPVMLCFWLTVLKRRRTQIRLAQRAYRERKETTISALEGQVNHLKQVIKEINSTFNDLSEKAVVSGVLSLQPAFNNDFCLAMERLNELNQRAGVDDDNLSSTFSTVSPTSRQSSISQAKPITPPTHAIHTVHYNEPIMLDSRHGIDDPSIGMLGYEFDYSPNTTSMIMQDANLVHTQGWSESWALSNAMTRDAQLDDQLSPISSGWRTEIPAGLPVTLTYSWQETSFARRLLRNSHEKCLYLLTSPTAKVNPKENRARYSLSFMTKDHLIKKLRRTMNKTSSEPLEDWTMPMLHVGGAGLHYPRDPAEQEPPPGFTAEQNTGPFQVPSAAISVPPIYFPDKVASWLGLEGVWFDNRDVEVYLHQRGINVDGKSSHTVVEVDDAPELSSPSSTSTSSDGLDSSGTCISSASRNLSSPQNEFSPNKLDNLISSNTGGARKRKVVISVEKLVDGE